MKFSRCALLICLGFNLLPSLLHAQNDKPPVTISPLNDHLYLIASTGGEEFNLPPYTTNLIASVGPDGILLVDAGFGATGPALRDSLKALGNGDLKMVFSTHYHGDHTSGNQYLLTDAPILAHRSVVEVMSGRFFHLPGTPHPNRPNVGFDDSLVVFFNGEHIRAIHAPHCHTEGDVYVHFTGSNIVAAGDLFFPDEIPYIDLPGRGSVSGYIAQIEGFINDFPNSTIFIAAHGRPYSKDDLRTYLAMLKGTTDMVRQAVADGRALDDMLESNLLTDWTAWKGQFPTTTLEAWIQTNYADLVLPANDKPSIDDPLTAILINGSVAGAVKEYYRLKAADPEAFDFSEPHLNMLGYQLLMRSRTDDALDIFRLVIDEYPNSANAYDSYGEGLMYKGDTAQSIINYEKSLELNPDNTNAVEMLKKLRRDELKN